jgi:heptosyltransferase-2
MYNILIVKKGALGDVVRTSYFARALRRKYGQDLRLSWLTSTQGLPLLRYNPHIDLLTDNVHDLGQFRFDTIYSLDDEQQTLKEVSSLQTKTLTGAYLRSGGEATYSQDAAEWFDMGLLSRLGKEKADILKRNNKRSHAEIFGDIFCVDDVVPEFFGAQTADTEAIHAPDAGKIRIGINPFAGGRWKSKQLQLPELLSLIEQLLAKEFCQHLCLLGAGSDYDSNCRIAASYKSHRLAVAFTDTSVLELAKEIADLDLLITSDSLALHLAVAQHVPIVAFFAPTSAVEIDLFGRGVKVVSTSADYCSYRSDADNSSITAKRLLTATEALLRSNRTFAVTAPDS